MHARQPRIRLKITDPIGNRCYVFQDRKEEWHCRLADGTNYALANITDNEMELWFALEDSPHQEAALRVTRARLRKGYTATFA